MSAFDSILCHGMIVDVLIAGCAVDFGAACLDARHKSPPRRGLQGVIALG